MSQDIDKEVEEYLSKNFGGFGAKPKETPKPAPVTPSASTPAQQEGKRDLETVITQLRERLADTVVGSPTHKRILSDLAEAQKALQGSKEPAAQEKPAEGQQDLASVFSAMSEQAGQPPTPAGQRQPVTSAFKLTPEQEQLGAGAVGAYVGSRVKPAISEIFLSPEQRHAEGIKKFEQVLRARKIMDEASRANLGQLGNVLENPLMSDIEYMSQSGRGEVRPQISGRQMESAHNWETQRQSLATKQNLQQPGAARTLVEAGPGVPTKSNIWVPKNVAATMAAEEAATTAQQIEKVQRTAATLAAQQLAENTPGPLARIGSIMTGPKITGALGGLGAGLSGYEAYQASKEGDPTGAALASLSGLSGIASMFPPAMPYALPIGLGIGGIQYMRSQLEPNRPISAEEEAAALRPAFGIYPSSGKRKVRSSS